MRAKYQFAKKTTTNGKWICNEHKNTELGVVFVLTLCYLLQGCVVLVHQQWCHLCSPIRVSLVRMRVCAPPIHGFAFPTPKPEQQKKKPKWIKAKSWFRVATMSACKLQSIDKTKKKNMENNRLSILPFCVLRVVESVRLRSLWVFASSLWLSFQILVPFQPPFSSFSCRVRAFLLPFGPMDSCGGCK